VTRRKREWYPDAYFHVVMRGNNRQNIFQTDEDQRQFLFALNFTYQRYPFTILAYCVMTNHYHLLIRSEQVTLGKVMARINRRYSDYYSKRYNHVGRIYEKRYFSKQAHGPQEILAISSYIHRNPIDTKIPMVENLSDYPYSSFSYYKNEKRTRPDYLNTNIVASFLPNPLEKTNAMYCEYCIEWKQFVEDE